MSQDGSNCAAYGEIPALKAKAGPAPRKELVTIKAVNDRADPCEAFAYHGFNGQDRMPSARIAEWILAK